MSSATDMVAKLFPEGFEELFSQGPRRAAKRSTDISQMLPNTG